MLPSMGIESRASDLNAQHSSVWANTLFTEKSQDLKILI